MHEQFVAPNDLTCLCCTVQSAALVAKEQQDPHPSQTRLRILKTHDHWQNEEPVGLSISTIQKLNIDLSF
jgi:hypothetical protein